MTIIGSQRDPSHHRRAGRRFEQPSFDGQPNGAIKHAGEMLPLTLGSATATFG